MLTTLSANAATLTSHAASAHPYGAGGGPGWWVVFPLLWFALLATVVVLVARRARRHGAPWARRATGLDVLGERYARGEIDEAEYRHRLAVLREDRR